MANKERPILFSGPMVRALLAGQKTVTRRAIKLQPHIDASGNFCVGQSNYGQDVYGNPVTKHFINSCCPYGKPGDRLWVRETWGRTYNVNGQDDWPGRPHIAREGDEIVTIYRADGPWSWCDDDGFGSDRSYWKPSIHMFRRDSRILLEVTDVRVERLQDITTEQIIAEGLSTTLREHDAVCDLRSQWRDLWTSTGGDWDANPWVWVVEFKRVALQCNDNTPSAPRTLEHA